ATVRLDGSGSSDPRGQALTFLWDFTSTPAASAASLQNATTVSPSFVADQVGEFIVRLTVTDAAGHTATDSVTVSVSAPVDVAPTITLNPTDVSIVAGQAAMFDAAAAGSPTPSVQWQRSVNGGLTFKDIQGETSTTLSVQTIPGSDGDQFRAVF